MENIKAQLPLSDEALVAYSEHDERMLEIDLDASEFPARSTLIYLHNIECQRAVFRSSDRERLYDLVDRYIASPTWLEFSTLDAAVFLMVAASVRLPVSNEILGFYRAAALVTDLELDAYVSNPDRRQNLERLIEVLANIPVFYFLATVPEGEARDQLVKANNIKVVDSTNYTGRTFINLFKLEDFVYPFYASQHSVEPTYYKTIYEQNCYRGSNLYQRLSQTPVTDILIGEPHVPSL